MKNKIGVVSVVSLLPVLSLGCVVGDETEPEFELAANAATYHVSTRAQFLSAIDNAVAGDHIKMPPSAVIDLTGERSIRIPGGVTISGGRSATKPGALLRTSEASGTQDNWNFLRTRGEGVTLRNLRLEGPDTTIGVRNTKMAAGISIEHDRTVVKNCELYGWPRGAVLTEGFDGVVIRENLIHSNIRVGRGYGVVVTRGGGSPTIEYNAFDRNRHAIAGTGHSGYIVRHNTFFAGFLGGGTQGMASQIDMHGVVESTLENGDDQAGTFIHVYANDFVIGANALGASPIAGIRGVPSEVAVFERNCVARTDSEWVDQSTRTVFSERQPDMSCYEKRGSWLCYQRTYGANMEKVVLQDNSMGQASGCRGYPYSGAFADDDGHEFESEINELEARGIVSGCESFPEPRFCPEKALSRGAAAKLVTLGFGLSSSGNYFDDDDGRWFEHYANALAKAGITTGVSARTFAGDRTITRGELITFISRALDLPPTSNDYFTDDSGTFYEDHANRARAAGITLGCSSSRFCGERESTRAEGAAFLARAL